METGYRLCREDNAVGEFKMPRCPEMELPPLEAYAQESSFMSYVDIDIKEESQMTVKLMQKAPQGKVQAPVVKFKSELDIKVERLIDLKVTIDAAKSSIDEYDKLRKELSAIADTAGTANEQVSFEVENGSVAFTAKTFERKISDMPKVFALLGKDNFLKLCKVTMTDLDKYLGGSEQESCVVKELTGARKISVIPKEKIITQD